MQQQRNPYVDGLEAAGVFHRDPWRENLGDQIDEVLGEVRAFLGMDSWAPSGVVLTLTAPNPESQRRALTAAYFVSGNSLVACTELGPPGVNRKTTVGAIALHSIAEPSGIRLQRESNADDAETMATLSFPDGRPDVVLRMGPTGEHGRAHLLRIIRPFVARITGQ